ncbi:PREDICTED: probable cytochrome P450 4d14 [Nicrophorus vespilloides]|uniref:Probable cytochrome P450 4d14 n=1 Tax=Nicrophorus vespilloides TaxID=110193 RepID=A0ABM1M862_NICVS|nr:PREDICTED: probable cytochrome P450 4d14 [Nicrophorus vespilloides]
MLAYVLIAILIVFLNFKSWQVRRRCKDVLNLPGPKNYPFIGTILEFGNNPVDFLKNLQRLFEEHGPILRFWNNTEYPTVMISGAKYMKIILGSSEHIHRTRLYRFLEVWLGNGILVADATTWRKHRKLLNPMFSTKILEGFIPTFQRLSDILVDKIRENVSVPFDIYPLINLYTLDLICESAMGHEINAQLNSDLQYVKSGTRFFELYLARLFSLVKSNDFLYSFMDASKKQIELAEVLKSFVNNVMKEKISNFRDEDCDKPKDMMDCFLKIARDGNLTKTEVKNEMDTFIFAGHDTVTTVLSMAIFELGKNQGVQERLFQEIDENISGNEEITLSKLNKLPYMECVLKETMRLHTPVPFAERLLQKNITIDGCLIPAKTNISVHFHGLHRDPEHFPNPDHFDPERFTPENIAKRNEFCFAPFSAGPRNCIGKKYAMMVMKYSVVKILKNFKINPVPGFDMILGNFVVLKSINGVFVNLHRVKMFTLVLMAILVGFLYFKSWQVRRRFKDVLNLPGPKNYPFIGTILEFGNNPVDFLKNMQRLFEEHGPILRFWNNTEYPTVMISGAKYMEMILGSSEHIHRTRLYRFLEVWVGNAILVTDATTWRKHRKLLNPMFSTNILEGFIPTFQRLSDTLLDKIRENVSVPFDIFPLINLYSLDLICESAMGHEINAQLNPELQYVKSCKRFLELHLARLFSLVKTNDFLYSFMDASREQLEHVELMKSFTNNVIKEKISNFHDENYDKPKDMMDIFLKIVRDGNLTQTEIRNEVDSFIFGGHDTVASVVSMAIYELGKNQDVQERLFKEIDENISGNEEITLSKLNKLLYMECVLKESMRRHPPVPFTERLIQEDITIDGCLIPAKTNICVHFHGLHRDPKHFPNPDHFDPERFTPENSAKRNEFCFAPFSAGPRNCIGKKYAMMVMKYTVVKILKNFRINPVPGFDMILGNFAVLKSVNGVCVNLQLR